MTDFALRGTFYLGDGDDRGEMEATGNRVMEQLLDFEESDGRVRDAAVALDMGARTLDVELIVTAETSLEAHTLADAAMAGAFTAEDNAQERSMELVPA